MSGGKKKQVTTGKVRAGGKGKAKKVNPPDEVTVRFQIAPGADVALAITAPYDMPWKISPIPGTKLSANGTIKKDAPIEVKLPLAMFTGGRTVNLVLEWGKDPAGNALTVDYMLDWAGYHAEAIGMRLVSLGYATGYLTGRPDLAVFTDPGVPAARPPVLTPPGTAIEQQAVLSFEADQSLEHRGAFDAATVAALETATGGRL